MTYLAQFYQKFTEQDPDSGFSSQVQAFIKITFFTKLVNIFTYALIAVFNSMHSVKKTGVMEEPLEIYFFALQIH